MICSPHRGSNTLSPVGLSQNHGRCQASCTQLWLVRYRICSNFALRLVGSSRSLDVVGTFAVQHCPFIIQSSSSNKDSFTQLAEILRYISQLDSRNEWQDQDVLTTEIDIQRLVATVLLAFPMVSNQE